MTLVLAFALAMASVSAGINYGTHDWVWAGVFTFWAVLCLAVFPIVKKYGE